MIWGHHPIADVETKSDAIQFNGSGDLIAVDSDNLPLADAMFTLSVDIGIIVNGLESLDKKRVTLHLKNQKLEQLTRRLPRGHSYSIKYDGNEHISEIFIFDRQSPLIRYSTTSNTNFSNSSIETDRSNVKLEPTDFPGTPEVLPIGNEIPAPDIQIKKMIR